MQASQVKNEFPRIEQCIDRAAELCQLNNQVPENLRECLGDLDRESDQAKQIIAVEQNDNLIIACIDRLEKLGDRAVQVGRQTGNVDERVMNAVEQAHDAIADLKHRLH